jgi:hypothetical protein
MGCSVPPNTLQIRNVSVCGDALVTVTNTHTQEQIRFAVPRGEIVVMPLEPGTPHDYRINVSRWPNQVEGYNCETVLTGTVTIEEGGREDMVIEAPPMPVGLE